MGEVFPEEFIAEAIRDLQPIVWTKSRFVENIGGLSPEQLAEARSILTRYAANFRQISSLSFRLEQETVEVGEESLPAVVRDRSYSASVTATRVPPSLHVAGADRNGNEILEILTPAGKISSGWFGLGGSQTACYIDGEFFFSEGGLLELAANVRHGMKMQHRIPYLATYVDAIGDGTYDVIGVASARSGAVREFWFCEETGMLHFAVGRSGTGAGHSFSEAVVVEYQEVEGIRYPRHWLRYESDRQIAAEAFIRQLELNGVSATRAGEMPDDSV
jgi:hypothetical protein